MQHQIEILIINTETGEILRRHRETMQLSPGCNPERRFNDFAQGFLRVLRDTSHYPHACIQITSKPYCKSIDYELFPSV